jgi:cysteine desulfurase family protein (TIGR01976 family)
MHDGGRPFDVEALRRRFPALARRAAGRPAAYLDGPGGTQVPDGVIEAVARTLREGVSNLGGGFPPSAAADAIVADARRAVSDLFGASPQGVVFGQNMTSLTFAMSRALARTWRPGDEIVLTRLDHDANVTPWRLAAAERGVAVRFADFDPADGRLDIEGLEDLLGPRTRLVAVTHASNALGSIPPVKRIVDAAHRSGALAYVDAVHAAPHRSIDVRALGCDVLVASAYKFFGPHTGMMVADEALLDGLEAFKVAPAPGSGPGRWETGTQSFESLAGVTAAVDYLASLGTGDSRRDALRDAMGLIALHEEGLARRFFEGASSIPGITIHGPAPGTSPRAPTFALTLDGIRPADAAARLAAEGIFAWSGHHYAVEATRRLGLLDRGGTLRIGFVHYSTVEEVDRVLEALARMTPPGS